MFLTVRLQGLSTQSLPMQYIVRFVATVVLNPILPRTSAILARWEPRPKPGSPSMFAALSDLRALDPGGSQGESARNQCRSSMDRG